MAEMTKDMYGAIGRIGNRTFYQRGGKNIVYQRDGAFEISKEPSL